jgi:hypothetical protein
VTARPVSAGVRRACQALAVAGGLAMMTGFLLAVVSAVAGPSVLGGRVPVSVIAPGLMVAGLCCGVMLIAVTAPGGRRRRPRAPAPARPRPSAPDPSREWIEALRPPGPPPVTGPIPVTRPPAGQQP